MAASELADRLQAPAFSINIHRACQREKEERERETERQRDRERERALVDLVRKVVCSGPREVATEAEKSFDSDKACWSSLINSSISQSKDQCPTTVGVGFEEASSGEAVLGGVEAHQLSNNPPVQ